MISSLKSRQLDNIIYFDGVCNLCNWMVTFVIKHDKRSTFSFSQLQSDFAKKLKFHVNVQNMTYDTLIYQQGENYYIKSEAVLRILKEIGGVWKLFYVLKIIPKPLRDWMYDKIARSRYRLFGKMDSCMIPSKEIQARFLN